MLIFQFFLFSFAGWVMESVQESVVRRRPVSKGFFRGPYVPVQGLGGLCVYLVCAPFRARPALVFLLGMAVCTAAEYVCSLFLEKCFHVKCWDYRTYPHTRWCHFQGRVCLTISLFFGVVSLVLVYWFWDAGVRLALAVGAYLPAVDGFCAGFFTCDALFRCAEMLRRKRRGDRLTGFAVFSAEG